MASEATRKGRRREWIRLLLSASVALLVPRCGVLDFERPSVPLQVVVDGTWALECPLVRENDLAACDLSGVSLVLHRAGECSQSPCVLPLAGSFSPGVSTCPGEAAVEEKAGTLQGEHSSSRIDLRLSNGSAFTGEFRFAATGVTSMILTGQWARGPELPPLVGRCTARKVP